MNVPSSVLTLSAYDRAHFQTETLYFFSVDSRILLIFMAVVGAVVVATAVVAVVVVLVMIG